VGWLKKRRACNHPGSRFATEWVFVSVLRSNKTLVGFDISAGFTVDPFPCDEDMALSGYALVVVSDYRNQRKRGNTGGFRAGWAD
jgi:hypothetical protein